MYLRESLAIRGIRDISHLPLVVDNACNTCTLKNLLIFFLGLHLNNGILARDF